MVDRRYSGWITPLVKNWPYKMSEVVFIGHFCLLDIGKICTAV